MSDTEPGADDGTSLTRHAVHAVGWSFFERWSSRLSSLVVFAILGHLLPIHAFGIVALATVIIDFLLLFADQGAPRAVVVERDPSPRFLNTAFWLSFTSGTVLFGLTLATAPLIAAAFNQPELTNIIRVLGLVFILYGCSNVQQAVLQRAFEFRVIAMRRVLSAIIGGLAGVVAALFGAGAWSLVLQTLVAYGVGALVLWVASPYRPGLSVGKSEAKSLWSFGVNVTGIDTLSWISRNGDNLVVGAALGPKALGIYSIAYKTFSIVTELVIGVITNTSLPLFAKVSHDMKLMTGGLLKATKVTAMLAAPVFATLAVEAGSIVPLMYGDKWHQAVPVVQIFCIAGLLNSVTSMDRSVMLAAGRGRLELLITAGGTVLNVTGFLIGVQWGYQGVAAALVIRAYIYWPVRLWALRSVTNMSINRYVRQWLVPVFASIVLILAAGGSRIALSDFSADFPEFPLLFISSALGLFAYATALFAIDGAFRRKVSELASKYIRMPSRPEGSPAR